MVNSNGIKISVSDEEAKSRDKTPAKDLKSAPRPAPKPISRSAAKKPVPKPIKKAKPVPKPKKKSGLVKFLSAMIVPSVIVGVGIYTWQSGVSEEAVNSVRKEARETETSFEERLRNLKNKLTGVEDENQKLKEQTEAMNKRIALLDKAKIDFIDEELGVDFTYPAAFGDITITTTEVASGTKFIGTFSDNEKLIFGGIDSNLESATASNTALAITDNQGYEKEKDKYYFLGFGENKYELKSVEALKTSSGKEALLIDKNSFIINPEADGLPVDIGGNVAVLVNSNNENYKGFAFMNSDFSMMPLESFKAMVNTINN